MRRADLLRLIAKEAEAAGVDFGLVREGGRHSIYRYGTKNVVIPRHNEINQWTARAILKDLGIGGS